MSKIQSTSQLAAIIRSQINSLRKPAQQVPITAKISSKQIKAKATAPADLAGVIALRVAGISAQDPDRRRKAFRIFLESVLLSELGEELMNDPKFFQMVDHIQHQMESDAELAPIVGQAVDLMLSATPSA